MDVAAGGQRLTYKTHTVYYRFIWRIKYCKGYNTKEKSILTKHLLSGIELQRAYFATSQTFSHG